MSSEVQDLVKLINESDYTLRYLLGRGSYSSVYLVDRKYDNKQFAAKFISFEYLMRTTQKSRLEVVSLVRAKVNNMKLLFFVEEMVGCYDYLMDVSMSTIIMEYCDGETLDKYLVRNHDNNGLNNNAIKYIIKQLISGVSGMHKLLIPHGDLKPSNLFILFTSYQTDSDHISNEESYKLKIGDPGLFLYSEYGSLTSSLLSYLGTKRYLGPEIIKNECSGSKTSDIWSIGIILIDLLFGYDIISANDLRSTNNINNIETKLNICDKSMIFLDIIKGCLNIDPKQRLSINQLKSLDVLNRDDSLDDNNIPGNNSRDYQQINNNDKDNLIGSHHENISVHKIDINNNNQTDQSIYSVKSNVSLDQSKVLNRNFNRIYNPLPIGKLDIDENPKSFKNKIKIIGSNKNQHKKTNFSTTRKNVSNNINNRNTIFDQTNTSFRQYNRKLSRSMNRHNQELHLKHVNNTRQIRPIYDNSTVSPRSNIYYPKSSCNSARLSSQSMKYRSPNIIPTVDQNYLNSESNLRLNRTTSQNKDNSEFSLFSSSAGFSSLILERYSRNIRDPRKKITSFGVFLNTSQVKKEQRQISGIKRKDGTFNPKKGELNDVNLIDELIREVKCRYLTKERALRKLFNSNKKYQILFSNEVPNQLVSNLISNERKFFSFSDLNMLSLSDSFNECFMDLFRFQFQLEKLHLQRCYIDIQGIKYLSNSLHYITNLVELKIAGCNLADESISLISIPFQKMKKLHFLSIPNRFHSIYKISDEGMSSLLTSLKYTISIRTLHAHNHKFGSKSIDLIKYLTHLVELNIGGNEFIKDDGIAVLSSNFKYLCWLKVLWINKIGITNDGLDCLVDNLKYLNYFRRIDICDNDHLTDVELLGELLRYPSDCNNSHRYL